MAILAMAQNLVVFFVGLELLSVPLYVLCGSALRRRTSLESGLKYLIVGSLGSATLLYGLAFIYGGSGSTEFSGIREGIGAGLADDPLILIGIALTATGLAFKLSIAPFHQWTPDVYQGAPTRSPPSWQWRPRRRPSPSSRASSRSRSALPSATGSLRLRRSRRSRSSSGNVGALTQSSLKRLLGYSGIAQAGYMLAGIVAANEAGIDALFFYLAAYAFMNLAAFAVITIRERETGFGDDIRSVQGLAASARCSLGRYDRDARPGGPAGDGGLHRQALSDRGVRRRRLHMARRDDRGRNDDLARVLPARDRGGLDAPRLPLRSNARGGPSRSACDGRRLGGGRRGKAGGVRCRVIIAFSIIAAFASVFFGIMPSPLVDFVSGTGEAIASSLG